jgi:hypothetical protein
VLAHLSRVIAQPPFAYRVILRVGGMELCFERQFLVVPDRIVAGQLLVQFRSLETVLGEE